MKTTIPILRRQWPEIFGFIFKGAALKARTRGGFLVCACPNCKASLPGGVRITLLGSQRDLNVDDGRLHLLAFSIHCPACDYADGFSMAVDQSWLSETGGGLES